MMIMMFRCILMLIKVTDGRNTVISEQERVVPV